MKNNNENKAALRYDIFIPMAILLGAAVLLGLFWPKGFYNLETSIVTWAINNFGWLFDITGFGLVLMVFFLIFSKYGNIKFGGPDAEPEIAGWNWFAMSLCAGIATGILFWGIAEPMTHFMNPPKFLGLGSGTTEAAFFSITTSYLHWTFTPYAMYGICGVVIAFAAYNMKLPYRVSSSLYPLFGEKSFGIGGTIVDNICLFSMACAVAAVLGVGTMQIGSGLNILTGVTSGRGLWTIIVAIIVATYIISSYTGLKRGIQFLSDQNTKIFLLLMIFVFIFGPTQFILKIGTESFGKFIGNFAESSFLLSSMEGSSWPRWWPIYYWAIWLAYAPLVGMFLARLVKGRTIRQFMLVNVLAPAFFGMFWFAVFGGSAINIQMNGGKIWETIQNSGLEVSVFAFLENFPLSGLMSFILIIAIYVSIVTMADSMTSTVSRLSTTAYKNPEQEPPTRVKFFWGIVMSAMAIINILAPQGEISGIDATKQLATVAGLPILFAVIAMTIAGLKAIIQHEKYDIANNPETAKIDVSEEIGGRKIEDEIITDEEAGI